jgi:hypothetical protein
MCKIFTANLREYKGPNGLNITIGTGTGMGLELFAPPNRRMVNRVIHNRHSPDFAAIWASYEAEFYAAMRTRYKQHPQAFTNFLTQHDIVVLLCYCQIGQACHRNLVVDILEKIAQYHKLPFERSGIK